MFIRAETGKRVVLSPTRGFLDTEVPKGVDEEKLAGFFQDYNDASEYLLKVYRLLRGAAYAAAEAVEVPDCLRADEPAKQLAEQATKASSSE